LDHRSVVGPNIKATHKGDETTAAVEFKLVTGKYIQNLISNRELLQSSFLLYLKIKIGNEKMSSVVFDRIDLVVVLLLLLVERRCAQLTEVSNEQHKIRQ